MSYLYVLMFLIPVLGVSLNSHNQNMDFEIVEIPDENTILPESQTELTGDEVTVTLTDDENPIKMNSSEKNGPEHIVLWKESTIFYKLSDTKSKSVSDKTKMVIKAAIKYLQNFSCLTFKQISNRQEKAKDHLLFITQNNTDMGECWSSTGRNPDGIGSHLVGVSEACDKGEVTHLIIRALGIVDEHRRPDRDDYVELLIDNVERPETFVEITSIQDNDMFFKFPYDYNSITHLSPTQYSKSKAGNAPTIRAKKENGKIAFQEEKGRNLSILDVIKINTAFGCFNTTAQKFSPKQMHVELSPVN